MISGTPYIRIPNWLIIGNMWKSGKERLAKTMSPVSYDMLNRRITDSERILFGKMHFFDMKCVRPTHVGAFDSSIIPELTKELTRDIRIESVELKIMDGFLQKPNLYMIQTFRSVGHAYPVSECIRIRSFNEFPIINQYSGGLDIVLSNNATVTGSSVSITPYSRNMVTQSSKLQEAIIMINHIIQIALLNDQIGTRLPHIIELVLQTAFPKSCYKVNFEEDNKLIIQVSTGDIHLYDILLSETSGTSTFIKLRKVHNLHVGEIHIMSSFIYLTCEILNALLTKRTIYV